MTNLQRIRDILDTSPHGNVMVDGVWYGRDKAMAILLDKELSTTKITLLEHEMRLADVGSSVW